MIAALALYIVGMGLFVIYHAVTLFIESRRDADA